MNRRNKMREVGKMFQCNQKAEDKLHTEIAGIGLNSYSIKVIHNLSPEIFRS